MKVRFALPALTDLESIIDYVAERSPTAADRIADRVAAVIQLMENQPEAGKRTNDPSIRRLNLSPHPYVVFYEIYSDEILVIGVRHGARDPASMPGSSDKPD